MAIHFIVNIICSFGLLISGYYMRFHAPKDKEMKMGLRNGHSQSSPEAWKFANETCGKYWLIFGGIGLALTIISLLVYALVGDDWANIFAIITPAVICVGTSSAVNVVNNGLRSKFDENGIPKE